jgi:hypothetical protein
MGGYEQRPEPVWQCLSQERLSQVIRRPQASSHPMTAQPGKPIQSIDPRVWSHDGFLAVAHGAQTRPRAYGRIRVEQGRLQGELLCQMSENPLADPGDACRGGFVIPGASQYTPTFRAKVDPRLNIPNDGVGLR